MPLSQKARALHHLQRMDVFVDGAADTGGKGCFDQETWGFLELVWVPTLGSTAVICAQRRGAARNKKKVCCAHLAAKMDRLRVFELLLNRKR